PPPPQPPLFPYTTLFRSAAGNPNNIPGLNVNLTPGVVPGDIGLAQSFNKDAANGRHTYATNGGATVAVATGSISGVVRTGASIKDRKSTRLNSSHVAISY